MSECDLSSVCRIKVGPVTAKPPSVRVRVLSLLPFAPLSVRVRDIRCPQRRRVIQTGRLRDRDRSLQVHDAIRDVSVKQVRITKLAERPLVVHARPPRVFVRGDCPALRIDGARHIAQPVVADTRIAEGN